MKTHGRRRSRGELRTQWIIQRRLGRGRINAVTFYPYCVTKITAAGDRRPYPNDRGWGGLPRRT
jgi:hypothetical protein